MLGREGFPPERCRLQRFGELRYVSQTHELPIPWPPGPTSAATFRALAAAFEEAHERSYGHRGRDNMIELVNLRLIAGGIREAPRVPEVLSFRDKAAPGERRRAYFGAQIGWLMAESLSRAQLADSPHAGPLVVPEFDSTILVPPDFQASRDRWSNVVLTRRT